MTRPQPRRASATSHNLPAQSLVLLTPQPPSIGAYASFQQIAVYEPDIKSAEEEILLLKVR